MQKIARMREKALHDEASAHKGAREEGAAFREVEIISKMRAMGMTDEQIIEIMN